MILAVERIPRPGPSSVLLVRQKFTELPVGERLTVTVLRSGTSLELTGTAEP